MARIVPLLTASVVGLACAGAEAPAPTITPVTLVTGSVVQLNVPDLLETYDVSALGSPLGVSIDPDTGRRLVLIDGGAIYDLDVDASEPIWVGAPWIAGSTFTDVADLGHGRLALTSTGEGYLLELATGSYAPHFCFEPGWWEPTGQDPVQISFAVAHDREGGAIYAQPRTIEEGGVGAVTESFIAAYDAGSGTDARWWSIADLDYAAGGMVVLETGERAKLLLGAATSLAEFDTETAELRPIADLGDTGIVSVGGLALDREAGTLLVADTLARRVVELSLSRLGL